MGVQIYIFHTDGGRQNIHIAVIDVAPLGCDGGGSGLVAQSLVRIVVVVHHHKPIQLRSNGQKCQHTQQYHHKQNSVMLPRIRPQAAPLPFFPSMLSHTPPAFPWVMGSSVSIGKR